MKKYDALYIFTNAPKDEALDQLVEKVSGEITRLGGQIVGTEMLGKRSFARPMKKRESGVYVRVRFEIAPGQIQALKARYALSEEVFRMQILAVDERREQLVAEQTAKRRAKAEAAAQAVAQAAAGTAATESAEAL
ncbi:MAG: 30S ribosomal protein S6 [Kiritimatiellae bacterium]|nr:30S ribosomal protein S6 [Kiritimatiellia bacterium]